MPEYSSANLGGACRVDWSQRMRIACASAAFAAGLGCCFFASANVTAASGFSERGAG